MGQKLSIREVIRKRVLIEDGAMGTEIHKKLVALDKEIDYKHCNDYLCLVAPNLIKEIHESYLESGADIIETNSFGASEIVLSEHGLSQMTYEINRAAAQIAREAAKGFSTDAKPRYVAGSIGPGSRLPSMMQVRFREMEESYYKQALGLVDGGVDLFQIETCQDILQIKAAYKACKRAINNRDIPIIVQVTMEPTGRSLLGTDVYSVISTFGKFDLLCLGMNCGTGPEDMVENLRILSRHSQFPISLLANAGLPTLVGDDFVYDMPPERYADFLEEYVQKYDVAIMGGCCGTSSDHIREMAKRFSGRIRSKSITKEPLSALSSLYTFQEIDIEPKPLIIGERTNVSGSKKFRNALFKENNDAMLDIAKEQQNEGAHVLDLSLSTPERNEVEDIRAFASLLNQELKIPVMIDSTNPQAIRAGLECLGGRAIINSINLEGGEALAGEILSLARDYGAAVVGLTIDEKGMAMTAAEKLYVAEGIIKLATEYGLMPKDLFIDPLTFTLASGDIHLNTAAIETLSAIKLIKEKYPEVNILLGVSNISYGLKPKARKVLNAVFLYHAVKAGLDAAILHAGKIIPLRSIPSEERALCENLIFNRKIDDDTPLEALMNFFSEKGKGAKTEIREESMSPEERLRRKIIDGRKDGVGEIINTLLQDRTSENILNTILLPAMKYTGELFGKGEMQLPFVLKSAESMKNAVTFLEEYFDKTQSKARGRFMIATVQGDIHDIGKNLVEIILRNNGYEVIDLGVNRTVQEIVHGAQRYKPDFIGLSGLLVKSALVMIDVLDELEHAGIEIPVFCGGAAITKEFVAKRLGEKYSGKVIYASSPFDALDFMNRGSKEHKLEDDSSANTNRASSAFKPAIYKNNQKPPFFGVKSVSPELEEIMGLMKEKRLFRERWKFKTNDPKVLSYAKEKFENIKNYVLKNQLIKPKASYGYFEISREEEQITVKKSETSSMIFTFEKQMSEPYLSIADYFPPKEGFAALQLVTAGDEWMKYNQELYKRNEYEDYMLFHNFIVEFTEALADYTGNLIKTELKSAKALRFSPGYPAWPALEHQKSIVDLLEGKNIGVSVSDTFQLVPELSTCALVVCHPEARYFSME